MCQLSNDIYDYHAVSQGKITIPNIDDGEEGMLTDVSGMRIEKSDPIDLYNIIQSRTYHYY